jgi:carbon-monoxide dehydrogenase medium subunit
VKPARFEYFRPTTVEEAVSLLDTVSDAKVLAGGQSLVPAMNFRLARPAALVDINAIAGLDVIDVSAGRLTIGALARHRAFEKPISTGPLGRLLTNAARFIGHLPIRVRGTLVGSLAHADPASEWCVIARVLDAEMVASSSTGDRIVAAADFFKTVFTTDLRPDELLTSVHLPWLGDAFTTGFAEVSRRAGDFALVLAAVVLKVESHTIVEARIAIGGASDRPLRMSQAEAALVGKDAFIEAIEEAAAAAADEVRPVADIHASADYRRDLVRVMVRRALHQALTDQVAS